MTEESNAPHWTEDTNNNGSCQNHPTALMWDMGSLKKREPPGKSVGSHTEGSGNTFCEKQVGPGEVENNAAYFHRHALVWNTLLWKPSNSLLVLNSSTAFCPRINFHHKVRHFLAKVMKFSLLKIWYFCRWREIKSKQQNPSGQEVKSLSK